jgi:hypothetical protein
MILQFLLSNNYILKLIYNTLPRYNVHLVAEVITSQVSLFIKTNICHSISKENYVGCYY